MPDQHLSTDTLAAYAAGTLSDGVSLLVASHLTYCAACRAEVARFEAVGGAALENLETMVSAHSKGPSLEATLAMIEAEPKNETPRPVASESKIPAAILAAIGQNEDDIRWKFQLPGVSAYTLEGYDGEKVQLLRAKPGSVIPSHTHEGQEATLVLCGQMDDGGTVLERGDVLQVDHHHDHTPRIIGDEVCICLVVTSGKLKFTGPLSRALNIFG